MPSLIVRVCVHACWWVYTKKWARQVDAHGLMLSRVIYDDDGAWTGEDGPLSEGGEGGGGGAAAAGGGGRGA